MADPKKKNLSEDPMAALLAELNLTEDGDDLSAKSPENSKDLIEFGEASADSHPVDDLNIFLEDDNSDFGLLDLNFGGAKEDAFEIKLAAQIEQVVPVSKDLIITEPLSDESVFDSADHNSDKTVAISPTQLTATSGYGTGDRTVAVAGYSNRSNPTGDENVKISACVTRPTKQRIHVPV